MLASYGHGLIHTIVSMFFLRWKNLQDLLLVWPPFQHIGFFLRISCKKCISALEDVSILCIAIKTILHIIDVFLFGIYLPGFQVLQGVLLVCNIVLINFWKWKQLEICLSFLMCTIFARLSAWCVYRLGKFSVEGLLAIFHFTAPLNDCRSERIGRFCSFALSLFSSLRHSWHLKRSLIGQ